MRREQDQSKTFEMFNVNIRGISVKLAWSLEFGIRYSIYAMHGGLLELGWGLG